ncbi:sulfur-oxidizing protein SoxB [Rhodobium orientis]|uniref:Thiosulfohydrolase SoxB n=1 Tax=Rhodobium orientis TaxID=34017 RepID=A0A327JTX7_9HYPH|nr:thiosulfohydrolase SoxB [Rhodobium orientis]MBB4302247.1 sulfur-oxidizing protein SoxB [Rhodobium orientis]MBK5948958.1 thiosulfohydrolase SoxB [Rhodobium orientis]RAI28956.1 thiosulfohydrolase SoxB [Rhodobium orientis]
MLIDTTRREFLQIALATAAIAGTGSLAGWTRAMAQQAMTEDDLLAFEPLGNVTLAHITDMHAQMKPVYFREPSVNIGVGEVAGLPPHITGKDFLSTFGIEPGSAAAYALTSVDFSALARTYGRMGGIDRIATIVNRIRAERPNNTLFLDGGDTWQGSYTTYQTKGADMVELMNALKPDAMTGHWEFTLGQDRVEEIVEGLPFPFLAGNVRDTEWEEPAFESTAYFERGGVKVAVIGQAFPYTPVANPRWMFPKWSFGIREEDVQAHVEAARGEGAGLVVLLSHNGFDVDRKLASRVEGIDVILTGHTHDALPEAVKVGKTLLVATGSNGKFVSRLDLDVGADGVKDFRYRLIPVFSDVITPDPETAALIDKLRAPYADELARVIGSTESLLYRRGNFNGTFDDLICDALLSERDAEIALSPGFRWGTSLIPGADITVEDIHTQTSMTYPEAYRSEMTGQLLKDILEDVADNLFNVDPYYQQGGDMVRVGGLGYTIDPTAAMGSRITAMTHLKSGDPIDPAKSYVVAGWASVNEGTEGPPVWDVVEAHIKAKGTVSVSAHDAVKVVGI